MKRFQLILCASLLTAAMASSAFAGNITTLKASGNITTMKASGNITTLSLTEYFYMILASAIV